MTLRDFSFMLGGAGVILVLAVAVLFLTTQPQNNQYAQQAKPITVQAKTF